MNYQVFEEMLSKEEQAKLLSELPEIDRENPESMFKDPTFIQVCVSLLVVVSLE